MQLLEETGKTLLDISIGKNFFFPIRTQSTDKKTKNWQMGLCQIKKLLHCIRNNQRTRECTEWEKMFTVCLSDKQ
jgi:hypothetical protein